LTLINLGSSGRYVAEERNHVNVPSQLLEVDVVTGEYVADTGVSLNNNERFGIANPANGVIGHYNDPKWLPKDRLGTLRHRIYSALDLLLPFFADETRSWTAEANKAAQEVRDFFPLAAEPGLWPYYKAEGKEFFAWVEKNAPPGRVPLPWETK